jgi:uncharacterized protein YraI
MIKRIAAAAVTLAAATAGSLAMTTTTASAADHSGQITASGGLTVRSAPSAHSAKVDRYKSGEKLGLGCWTYGTSVDGNRTWYSTPTDSPAGQWLSGRYVKLLGKKPPKCTGAAAKGTVTADLSVRRGPNTADNRIGSLDKGSSFRIVCQQPGTSVNGNNRWYLTTSNASSAKGWVSARYVDNVGKAPQWCHWPN